MRRTEYDAGRAAKRMKVPAATFRWARHTGLAPAPDVSSSRWSRAAVEAMNADAIQAAMPVPPIGGGAVADRIAAALGTPNVIGEKANVTVFVVRRFVDRGLLADLSTTLDGTLHHPRQVDQVCQREDLADLVAADSPLGPEQAAALLRVHRVDFDHMARLGWIRSPQSIEVRFGTSRAGAVDVALHDCLRRRGRSCSPAKVGWRQLRAVEKDRRSPLASLRPEPAAASA
ncbi:hypothetical protein [Streptomyces sp. NRRL S-31]|uniref:hypothetical protein n=1 Tax=Streptomyces sp. NRRL S-31 TaxID=1463898 RepID=UPI0004C976C2|nr:hypothetical protein [Streptomyces sp. NRRL S-31]